jgi:hypothetical protein
MMMEQTGRSETSAYKTQTPGNHPEESIQHSEHGESLKSRNNYVMNCVRHSQRWVSCAAIPPATYDVTWSQHTHRTPHWGVTRRISAVVYRRTVTACRFSSSRVKQPKTVRRLKSKGEKISDVRSRPWLDFVQRRPVPVGPQCGTCLMPPFWRLEFGDGF